MVSNAELITKKLRELVSKMADLPEDGTMMSFEQEEEIDRYWNEEIQPRLMIGKTIDYSHGMETIFGPQLNFEAVLKKFRGVIEKATAGNTVINLESVNLFSKFWYEDIHPRMVQRKEMRQKRVKK